MSAPLAYYNVEVISRSDSGWVIYIPTGPGIGNTYEILGDTDTYTVDIRHDQPEDAMRQSVIVGRVAVDQLSRLEMTLTNVHIKRHDHDWQPKNWVWDVLCNLRDNDFEVAQKLGLQELETKMTELLYAQWRKQAVFVGGRGLAFEDFASG